MTKEEAIEELKGLRASCATFDIPNSVSALDMAIEALQYITYEDNKKAVRFSPPIMRKTDAASV